MYIRFVLTQVDDASNRRKGLLTASHSLMDSADIDAALRDEIARVLGWFNEHLRVPSVLRQPEHFRAISWFKPEAKRPIQRMWDLTYLLRAHGLVVEVLQTDSPGSVIYEDKWQLVAKPPKGTKLGW